MKKSILPAFAALSILLTGCSSKQIDPTPIELNKSDSFAMQVLKSGFDHVPFNIKDAVVASDAEYNTVNYGVMGGLGFLGNGGMGALSGLGMGLIINAGGNMKKDYIHYIAWIPADNIDITDKAAIDAYIKTHYLGPAVNAFIASDFNKNTIPPTELVNEDTIDIKVKGSSCWPLAFADPTYGECQMFYHQNIHPIRYATVESGIPFTPEVKANRYIVVRITDAGYRSVGAVQYLNSNMIYAYMPAGGYMAAPDQLNRFAPEGKPVIAQDFPYVIGENKKINLFVKKAK